MDDDRDSSLALGRREAEGRSNRKIVFVDRAPSGNDAVRFDQLICMEERFAFAVLAAEIPFDVEIAAAFRSPKLKVMEFSCDSCSNDIARSGFAAL